MRTPASAEVPRHFAALAGLAAMHDHGGIERIGKSVHAHPTLSEMVKAAAKAAK